MTTYVFRNGQLIDKRFAAPLYEGDTLQGAPQVVSDTMEATRHMADGQFYTSKAAFRRATKAAGCLEVGNETNYLLQPRKRVELDRSQRRDAIRQAIYELKNRRSY